MRDRQRVQAPPPRPRATGAAPTPLGLLRPDTLPALQRLAGNRAATAAVQREDQRADTFVPSASQQAAIQNELHPALATTGGNPARWDGARDRHGALSTAAATARQALITEVTTALDQHLTRAMVGVAAAKQAAKLPMTSFEGAGRAAKNVVDAEFGSWARKSVLTAPQRHVRSTHQFSATGQNRNLLDATSPRDRTEANQRINPNGVTIWMADNDAESLRAQANHHFDRTRGPQEWAFLRDRILRPFLRAHYRDLLDYDLYMFGMADPSTGRIVAGPQLTSRTFSQPAATGDDPSAARATMWWMWKLLIHEYLHTLEHPAYAAAHQGNAALKEGFCEMFAQEVLFPAQESAAKGGNGGLVDEVEGRHNTAPPGWEIVGTYETPAEYVAALGHALAITDTILGNGVQGGGEKGVRAAFFQGHVEFLGLDPTGAPVAAPPQNPVDLITVPANVTTLAELAQATGVKEADLVSDNAQANIALSATAPLPARLHARYCRDHVVVAATDRANNTAVESQAEIAAQNGVKMSDLARANPGLNWPALAAGDRVLVPFH